MNPMAFFNTKAYRSGQAHFGLSESAKEAILSDAALGADRRHVNGFD